MEKTDYGIAKKLVEFYKYGDINKMNEKAKCVAYEVRESGASKIEESDKPLFDEFSKRIKRIRESFEKNTGKLMSENSDNMDNIFPSPIFQIFQYSESQIVDFLKAYIEESNYWNEFDKDGKSNRKSKYMYDTKVDLDKQFEFVFQVLNKKQGIKFKEFNEIDDKFFEYYNQERENFKIISIKRIKGKLDILKGLLDKEVLKKYENLGETNTEKKFKYIMGLAIEWLNRCQYAKRDMAFVNVPWDYMGKYRMFWRLWLWIFLQTVQYIMLERVNNFKESNLNKLFDKLKVMEKGINNEFAELESMNKNYDIYKGYFMYNYLLRIRDETVEDIEIQRIIFDEKSGNKHYPLSDKFCFVDKDNQEKKWVQAMNKECQQQMFDIGLNKCKNQKTFQSRIFFCKDFVNQYNRMAGRNLCINDMKTLRAVYRALYVDKISYNRNTLYSMAKKIIQDEDCDRKQTYHYIVGNVISAELLTEYNKGEFLLKFKIKLLECIYKIALNVFYKYCPCMGGNFKEFLNAIEVLEDYFNRTIKVIYECLYI